MYAVLRPAAVGLFWHTRYALMIVTDRLSFPVSVVYVHRPSPVGSVPWDVIRLLVRPRIERQVPPGW